MSSNFLNFLLLAQQFSLLKMMLQLLETTWKQAWNESFKVHEMEQLY
jgi:hypothetical protein